MRYPNSGKSDLTKNLDRYFCQEEKSCTNKDWSLILILAPSSAISVSSTLSEWGHGYLRGGGGHLVEHSIWSRDDFLSCPVPLSHTTFITGSSSHARQCGDHRCQIVVKPKQYGVRSRVRSRIFTFYANDGPLFDELRIADIGNILAGVTLRC